MITNITNYSVTESFCVGFYAERSQPRDERPFSRDDVPPAKEKVRLAAGLFHNA